MMFLKACKIFHISKRIPLAEVSDSICSMWRTPSKLQNPETRLELGEEKGNSFQPPQLYHHCSRHCRWHWYRGTIGGLFVLPRSQLILSMLPLISHSYSTPSFLAFWITLGTRMTCGLPGEVMACISDGQAGPPGQHRLAPDLRKTPQWPGWLLFLSARFSLVI